MTNVKGVQSLEGVNLLVTHGGAVIYSPLPQWAKEDASVERSQEEMLNQTVVCSSITVTPDPDSTKLWDLETMGLEGEKLNSNEKGVEELVSQSITNNGNQYAVGLPVKSSETPPHFVVDKAQVDSNFTGKLEENGDLKDHNQGIIGKDREATLIEQVHINPKEGHFPPPHLIEEEPFGAA